MTAESDPVPIARRLDLDALRSWSGEAAALSGCLLAAASATDEDEASQLGVMRWLLDQGVPVDERDKNGVTPLHRAVRFRNVAAAEFLIAAGADVDARCRRSGSTPLHRATTGTGAPRTAGKSSQALAIARALIAAGADPRLANRAGKTPAAYAARDEMRALLSE